MMYSARRSLITTLLIGILLTSCGGQIAAGQPTPDINATIASGAQTLAAAIFQTQTAIAPSATYTPLASVTPLPTATALALPTLAAPSATQAILVYYPSPTPTGTYYTATPNPSSLSSGCNNLQLIESYTSPDGPFLPGQDFTQSWQVNNNGTCDWMYVYQVVFVSGDKLGEATSVKFGNRIPPGKWTTISVNLHAPQNAGTYSSTWRFSDGGGKLFGATLPVSITVKKKLDPTKTPDVLQTAVAGTVAAQMTQTAAAQQTAISVGLTAIACQTAIKAGTPPPCP